MELGIRVDIQEDFNYDQFKAWLQEKTEPLNMVITREISSNVQKEHLHIYIKSNVLIDKKFSTYRKALNKDLREIFNLHKHNKSIELIKDVEKYLIYILKDGDILENDLEEDYFNELMEKTNEINEDKKIKQYQKVYNHLKDKKIKDTSQYIKRIHELYIEEFNQAPPQRHIIINSLQYYLYEKQDYYNLTKLLSIPELEFNQREDKDNDEHYKQFLL